LHIIVWAASGVCNQPVTRHPLFKTREPIRQRACDILGTIAKEFTNLWLSFLTAVFFYSGQISYLGLGEYKDMTSLKLSSAAVVG
jgi:hypothetical protein